MARSNRGLIRLRIGFLRRTSSANFEHFGGFQSSHHTICDSGSAAQNLSLLARISAKTVAAVGIGQADCGLQCGQVGAQEGVGRQLVGKVDGTVGRPSARLAATSALREISAALSGSRVTAKRRFDAVYSWPEQISVSGGRAASFRRLAYIWAGVPSNRRPQPPAIRLSAVKARPAVGEMKGDMADGVAGHVDHPGEFRRRWQRCRLRVRARSSGGRRWASAAAPRTMAPVAARSAVDRPGCGRRGDG